MERLKEFQVETNVLHMPDARMRLFSKRISVIWSPAEEKDVGKS